MPENHKNDACKTYLEQTKLLVTLASAFIVAPAIFSDKLSIINSFSIWMELFFIGSVFAGYVVFGTISGTQYNGKFDVYNIGTRVFSYVQILLFILGLVFLVISLKNSSSNLKEIPKKDHIQQNIIHHSKIN
jgi:hypothetical protein